MKIGANDSNEAAQHAVKEIIDGFGYQLKSKEAVKVLPQYMQRQFVTQNKHILYLGGVPRPKKRIQDYFIEDAMVVEPPIEGLITAQVPVVKKKDLQLIRTATASAYQSSKRNLSSRYVSTGEVDQARKRVKIQLSLHNNDKPVQLAERSAQSTAKSFRSVRELQSQIKTMRSTYLKKIRQQAQAKMSMTQQLPVKRKRVPHEFTFDINGQILAKNAYIARKTVFKPLQTKAVSAPKISHKSKKIPQNPQVEDNVEQILQRADTKTGERKKRQFSNGNKRQVSHIPFISMTDNSKLIQNLNVVQGPQTQKDLYSTARSNGFRSTFSHHFKQTAKPAAQQLLYQEEDNMVNFPNTFKPKWRSKESKQGSILKNSRFSKQKSQIQSQLSIDFNPANVTREHGIDQYYRISMPVVHQ